MAISIPTRSRLQFANLVKVTDRTFWDMPLYPKFEAQIDDVVYQWDQLDRIEDIAQRFYQDQRLWWIIAKRNKLIDLPTSIRTGDRIVIPSRRWVFEELFKKK